MRHLKLVSKTLCVLFTIAAVSACGFHLRGNIPLPDGIKNMYIVAPDGTFKDNLEENLTNAGATLAANKAGADVVLNVSKAVAGRDVGTLDERGKVSSYNLTFTVEYTLNDPEGKQIRDAKLKEKLRYDFSAANVIEAESEEQDLLEDLEQEISLRIVRQLSTVTDYPPVNTK